MVTYIIFAADHHDEVRKFVSRLVLALQKIVKNGRGRPRPLPKIFNVPDMA